MFYGIDLDFFDIGDIVIDIGRLTGRGAGTDLKSVCFLECEWGSGPQSTTNFGRLSKRVLATSRC